MSRAASIAMMLLLALAGGCGLDEAPATPMTSSTPAATGATPEPPVASETPSPTESVHPTPTPRALHRLRGADVVAAIDPQWIQDHLVAFQAIADRAGGTRASGTSGYLGSVRHVTDALVSAGYAPVLEPFTAGTVQGTNVIVERSGTAGRDIVMIGAHLDSVPEGPGINDNGSGVAVLLTLAEALAALPAPHHTVRFAFWDAEEGGPFGSAAYVDAMPAGERDRIVAYLNLDMVGSPNPVRFVYDEAAAAPGSDALTDAFAAAFEAEGLAWDPIDLEGDSDHGPFTAAGIPTGGVFSGGIEVVDADQAARHGAIAGLPSDACSHRACDTLRNVNPRMATEVAQVVATVLVELASP